MPEPTIADVLAAIDGLKTDMKITGLEDRVRFAELKLDVQTLRGDVQAVRADVQELRSKVNLLFDFVADFRREYNEHTHPDAA